MARPRKEGVQFDRSKGRYFCRIDYSDQRPRKIHLTTDETQSAAWYEALALLVSDDPENGPSNHDEACRRVMELEDAQTTAEERRIIDLFTAVPEDVPEWTYEIAAHQLSEIMGFIGKHASVTHEMIEDWWRALDSDACDKLLVEWGYPASQIHKLRKWGKLQAKRPNPDWVKAHPVAKETIWRAYLREKGVPEQVIPESPQVRPSKETLKACFPEWERRKLESDKPLRSKHVGEVRSSMRQFLKVVRDKPISLLSKLDFLEWNRYLLERQKEKGWSADTFNGHIGNVGSVFRYLRKEADWPFPEGITEWVEFNEALFETGD